MTMPPLYTRPPFRRPADMLSFGRLHPLFVRVPGGEQTRPRGPRQGGTGVRGRAKRAKFLEFLLGRECVRPTAAEQTPPTPPAFEVASLKPAWQPERSPSLPGSCSPGGRLTVTGRRVDIRWMSLRKLLFTAYIPKRRYSGMAQRSRHRPAVKSAIFSFHTPNLDAIWPPSTNSAAPVI